MIRKSERNIGNNYNQFHWNEDDRKHANRIRLDED